MRTAWVRFCAVCAMVGGIGWMWVWATYGMRPPASGGAYRQAEDMHVWMFASLTLVLIGQAALWHRFRARLSKGGHAAFLFAFVGPAVMGAARWAQHHGGDPFPTFAIGWLILTVSLFTLALRGLRRPEVPVSVRWALLVAALSFFLLNDQSWRAWLALPFGAAWIWLGRVLLHGRPGAVRKEAL